MDTVIILTGVKQIRRILPRDQGLTIQIWKVLKKLVKSTAFQIMFVMIH